MSIRSDGSEVSSTSRVRMVVDSWTPEATRKIPWKRELCLCEETLARSFSESDKPVKGRLQLRDRLDRGGRRVSNVAWRESEAGQVNDRRDEGHVIKSRRSDMQWTSEVTRKT